MQQAKLPLPLLACALLQISLVKAEHGDGSDGDDGDDSETDTNASSSSSAAEVTTTTTTTTVRSSASLPVLSTRSSTAHVSTETTMSATFPTHTPDPTSVSPSSPSTTISDDSPSPSPSEPSPAVFTLLPPANATTCQRMTLRWRTDVDASIPVDVSLVGTRISAASDSRVARNVSALLGQYTWPTLDVAEGSYVAAIADSRTSVLYAQSPPFLVRAGNTSCLAEASQGGGGHLSTGVLVGTIVAVLVVVFALIAYFTFPSMEWWKRPPSLPRRRQPGAYTTVRF